MIVSTETVDLHANTIPVDWANVREVYRKLHSDFAILVAPFNIPISAELNADLAHLICAIDSIDRNIDAIKIDSARVKQMECVIAYLRCDLRGDTMQCLADNELQRRLQILKTIVYRKKIQTLFCDTASEIFNQTEKKRMTRRRSDWLNHLFNEWRLTGELTLLFLGPNVPHRFKSFFLPFCVAMSTIDSIKDVNSDFQNGMIRVKPGLSLKFLLFRKLVVSLPGLLVRFPKPIRLLRYLGSFLNNVFKDRKFERIV